MVMGSAMGWEVQTPNDRIKQKRLPPSVRKEAANLWERRLTSSNSRSITLVVRSYSNRLSGRHKRSDSLPDQIALEALDGCWVGELYFLIKRPRSAVIALVPSLQGCMNDSAGKFCPDIMPPKVIASVQKETEDV